jgi:TM2 domain-containing membrane protein YozV
VDGAHRTGCAAAGPVGATGPAPYGTGMVPVQPVHPVYPGTAPVYSVQPKSPGISLLVSFFIPGVGSMINGDVGIGVGILIGYIVSWFLTLILIGFIGVIGFWIWGMVDAYRGAQRWNAKHGIIS